MPLIGVLVAGSAQPRVPAPVEALLEGLRDLGYIDGRTIKIEYRWAEGKPQRLPELAVDLVRAGVDLIVATGDASTRAARTGPRRRFVAAGRKAFLDAIATARPIVLDPARRKASSARQRDEAPTRACTTAAPLRATARDRPPAPDNRDRSPRLSRVGQSVARATVREFLSRPARPTRAHTDE